MPLVSVESGARHVSCLTTAAGSLHAKEFLRRFKRMHATARRWTEWFAVQAVHNGHDIKRGLPKFSRMHSGSPVAVRKLLHCLR